MNIACHLKCFDFFPLLTCRLTLNRKGKGKGRGKGLKVCLDPYEKQGRRLLKSKG